MFIVMAWDSFSGMIKYYKQGYLPVQDHNFIYGVFKVKLM